MLFVYSSSLGKHTCLCNLIIKDVYSYLYNTFA